jgi:hypothetical protein
LKILPIFFFACCLLLTSCTSRSAVEHECSGEKYDEFGPYCVNVIREKHIASETCKITIMKSMEDQIDGYGVHMDSPIDVCAPETYSFQWTEQGLDIKGVSASGIETSIRVPKKSFTGGR